MISAGNGKTGLLPVPAKIIEYLSSDGFGTTT
jgi:hypothetical protein